MIKIFEDFVLYKLDLKKGDYVVTYREKFLDALFLRMIDVDTKHGNSLGDHQYHWDIIDSVGWEKNPDLMKGRTRWMFLPNTETETLLYSGSIYGKAQDAFDQAKLTIQRLASTRRFDL